MKSQEKMNKSGNVGIGTDVSPSARLHIRQSGNNDRDSGLYVQRAGTPYGAVMYVDDGGYVRIGTKSDDPALPYDTDYITLATGSGNVGIGTPMPAYKLDVKGSLSALGRFDFLQSGYDGTINNKSCDITHDGTQLKFRMSGSGGTVPINFSMQDNSALYIDGNRNVGIGTTSPDTTLDVNGSIWANGSRPIKLNPAGSITIQASLGGWADFLHFLGSSGTDRGGFGAAGSDDNLTYLYAGDSYSNPTMVWKGGKVGIGTVFNPSSRLHIGQSSNDRDGGLYIQRAGTEYGAVMYVDSDGRVRIGTKSDSGTDYDADYIYLATGSGNVGIGTTSPAAKLDVNGNAVVRSTFYALDRIGIGTASPEYMLDVNGDAIVRGSIRIYGGDNGIRTYASGQVVSALIMHAYPPHENRVVLIPDTSGFRITDHINKYINFEFDDFGNLYHRGIISGPSDARLKFNQQPLEYGLPQVLALKTERYDLADWSVDEETEEIVIHPESMRNTIGLVAQDVYPIIPEAVHAPEDDTKEVWSISYQTIIPVLIKAIQEQQAQIDGAQRAIEELKRKNEALVARVAPLQSGEMTDTPLTADFDGDGRIDRALVSANGDWYFWLSGSEFVKIGPYNFGVTGKPVASDFDGDGKADPGMVDSNGNWYVWFSGSGYSRSKL